MDIHSICLRAVCSEIHMRACEREFVQMKMREVCEELIQLKKTHKEVYRNLSKQQKSNIRKYRHTIDQRIRAEAEEKAAQDGLREWANVVFHYWDTRNAPSNELEYEASMEMPYSQKKWFHN